MKIVTFISDEQDKLAPPEDIEKLIEDCTAAAYPKPFRNFIMIRG